MSDLLAAQLVGLGGAVGAVARYLVGEAVPDGPLPVGTLVVNVAGSFTLGLVTGLVAEGDLALLLGTGACGSFTTYSSFAVETVELYEQGRPRRAAAYAVGTLLLCALAVGAAWLLAGVLG